jgi:dTDP-4-dehydrorhamnose 3,5-epimerase-like enzyme
MNKPQLIKGGVAVDDRGTLRFVNDFHFEGVRRFYEVSNFSKKTVRAWHGHKRENKWVYVAKGSAIVAAVEFDHDTKPSRDKEVHRFVLSDKNPAILAIPAGYANGFRALEPDTRIVFFSSSVLEDAKNDDFRFPHDYWGTEVWEVIHR